MQGRETWDMHALPEKVKVATSVRVPQEAALATSEDDGQWVIVVSSECVLLVYELLLHVGWGLFFRM